MHCLLLQGSVPTALFASKVTFSSQTCGRHFSKLCILPRAAGWVFTVLGAARRSMQAPGPLSRNLYPEDVRRLALYMHYGLGHTAAAVSAAMGGTQCAHTVQLWTRDLDAHGGELIKPTGHSGLTYEGRQVSNSVIPAALFCVLPCSSPWVLAYLNLLAAAHEGWTTISMAAGPQALLLPALLPLLPCCLLLSYTVDLFPCMCVQRQVR